MATQNIYDLSDTWNDGGTVFTAIKMDVTDTASDAASLLMDLQVGSTSKLNGTKAGAWLVSDGSKTAPAFSFINAATVGMYWRSGVAVGVASSSKEVAQFSTNGNLALGGNTFTMTSSGGGDLSVSGGDVKLYADAANTFGQRNGTNAQTFNIYNTYTDASNYERGVLKWNSNVLELGTEAAGTGTARHLKFKSATGTILANDHFSPALTGSKDLGSSGLRWRWAYLGSTVTGNAPSLDIAQTWNNGAVAFTSIKANVIDTASDAASLLMDLQVGGATKFKVGKTGQATANGGVATPDAGELTIATGAITVTGGYHTVDTESDAASDDLDTISSGSDGQILVIQAEDGARTVVAKDGTGNLQLAGDFSLDNAQDTLTLMYSAALSAWVEISRSDNGA